LRMLQVGPSAFLLLEQLLTELHITINPKANVIILFWCDPYTDIVVIRTLCAIFISIDITRENSNDFTLPLFHLWNIVSNINTSTGAALFGVTLLKDQILILEIDGTKSIRHLVIRDKSNELK